MTELAINLIRIDGGTQPRAELDYGVIQDYAQQMWEGAVFPDVIVFYDGVDYWLGDGFHRYHAKRQICRETINAEVRQGTRRDAQLYSVGANATHGLRRTNADKRRAVETLLRDEEWGKWSDNQIAKQCGVNQSTVSRIRQENPSYAMHKIESRYAERNGTVYTVNTANIGLARQEQQTPLTLAEVQALEPQPGPLYGTVYQSPTPVEEQLIEKWQPPTPEQLEARAQYLERWQQDNLAIGLDRWGDPLPEDEEEEDIGEDEMEEILDEIEEEYHDALAGMQDAPVEDVAPQPVIEPDIDAKEKRDAHVMRVMGSSDSPEWYTPQDIIDCVCELFGSIDTDPCSNSHTSPAVPAYTLYTKEDDGLSQIWTGRTYLNPPYGTEIGKWTDKLIAEYKRGNVQEALALLPARIDTVWFSPLYEYLMCNIRGRLQFANSPYNAPFPCVVVYLGAREADFINVFHTLGPIMRKVG